MHQTLTADLHVHSKYSKRPSQWLLQKLGCPESFTEPELIYTTARRKGMDLMTITDHNVIEGALSIAHLPGTFVSEEITTYFPEDGCKLHVLAYDITETQHREIQLLRKNVFELIPWLREQDIVHVLAHPLFAVNERLTIDHLEQCLLLFNTFECNGCRDQLQNEVLQTMLREIDRPLIERLADKHDLAPHGTEPWIKGLTGGSDDHSSLNIGSMYTAVREAGDVRSFLHRVRQGQATPHGTPATPMTMAHNLYSIAYQFYKDKSRVTDWQKKSEAFRFADAVLDFRNNTPSSLINRMQGFFGRRKTSLYFRFSEPASLQQHIIREAEKVIAGDPALRNCAAGKIQSERQLEQEWFRFVATATDRLFAHLGDRILHSAMGANIFDIFHTIGSAGSLYSILSPYFVGYGLFSREQTFGEQCLEAFAPGAMPEKDLSVAHFTDTFDDVNGVARTLRRQVGLARSHDKKLTILHCNREEELRGIRGFRPSGSFEVPEYPELSLTYPPFLRILAHCFEAGYSMLLAATPGPMGLAALAVSKILGVPVHGTYHTAFPQYVGKLTGDSSLEDMTWKYMAWFYNQMDIVYAPSKATKVELVEHGIEPGRIVVYPRGVDSEQFHPDKDNGVYRDRYDIDTPCTMLYAGRISREKNLDVLAEAFEKVITSGVEAHLVLVGDGPYREEMASKLKGLPVTFTGYLKGDDLSAAFAGADMFVFPSATDTFGNVVLEAMASGLPVIATDRGGPRENITHERTGLIVPAGEHAPLAAAIRTLAENEPLRARMGAEARSSVETRTFDATFLETWEIFQNEIQPVTAPAPSIYSAA
jgi:glycosyltransferase involved in cell wall biosynthesis